MKDGTIKIIKRKASDLSKVTDKTIKSYINDAAKYGESSIKKSKGATDKIEIILHVEKKGNLSKDVLEHATKKGVEIVDDLSKVL